MDSKTIGVAYLKHIVLASSSPRRRQLLQSLGIPFTVYASHVNEDVPDGLLPEQVVSLLAERKAKAVADSVRDSLVIGADTIVFIGDRILGKPRNAAHAEEMLALLSGNTHVVLSGICIIDSLTGQLLVRSSATSVTMKQLSAQQIRRYVSTGEPMDKAGSYAIQGLGATLVKGIHGDYFNVVGLPLSLLSEMLLPFGIDVLSLGEGDASEDCSGE